MTKEDFEQACEQLLTKMRQHAPYRKGNLSKNALRLEFSEDSETCTIYVDEEIAPYMVFTNEKWISPKWNGKQNPNENWWQNTVEQEILPYFASLINGDIR